MRWSPRLRGACFSPGHKPHLCRSFKAASSTDPKRLISRLRISSQQVVLFGRLWTSQPAWTLCPMWTFATQTWQMEERAWKWGRDKLKNLGHSVVGSWGVYHLWPLLSTSASCLAVNSFPLSQACAALMFVPSCHRSNSETRSQSKSLFLGSVCQIFGHSRMNPGCSSEDLCRKNPITLFCIVFSCCDTGLFLVPIFCPPLLTCCCSCWPPSTTVSLSLSPSPPSVD